LLVVRSDKDDVNRGTLFRKEPHGRLSVVDRIHGGSEVETLLSGDDQL